MLRIHRTLTAAGAALSFVAPAALAGGTVAQSFDVEIGCEGEFAPGEQVPFRVRVEELALEERMVKLHVEVDPPGLATKTIVDQTFSLYPEQLRSFKGTVNLPLAAPPGRYNVWVIADDSELRVVDTCWFSVP